MECSPVDEGHKRRHESAAVWSEGRIKVESWGDGANTMIWSHLFRCKNHSILCIPRDDSRTHFVCTIAPTLYFYFPFVSFLSACHVWGVGCMNRRGNKNRKWRVESGTVKWFAVFLGFSHSTHWIFSIHSRPEKEGSKVRRGAKTEEDEKDEPR